MNPASQAALDQYAAMMRDCGEPVTVSAAELTALVTMAGFGFCAWLATRRPSGIEQDHAQYIFEHAVLPELPGLTKERSDAEFLTGMAALIQSDRFKTFSVMLLRRGQ